MKTLITIAGPTAIGKTKMAIEVAQALGTEILSADSRQFYKELKIGVAAPSNEELAQVPHHFIGHLSIHDYYNVSRYEIDALNLLESLFQRYNQVVVVGGSGLYLDTLCGGISELPDADEALRASIKEKFEQSGIEYLREQVKILDPVFYETADISNPMRLLRAMEVTLQTGIPYSQFKNKKQQRHNFRITKIGLEQDREVLYNRINQRVDLMVEMGLLEEVQNLLPNKNLNALNTVGYKELFEYFEGKVTLEHALENIKTHTRRYAKRQMTWFKRDSDIQWFGTEQKIQILQYINSEDNK